MTMAYHGDKAMKQKEHLSFRPLPYSRFHSRGSEIGCDSFPPDAAASDRPNALNRMRSRAKSDGANLT